ncbi:hypothetical protein PHLGIDRAFT_35072 [Phlebiopsis gigantea 11061_1 CR5-6]|uniref:Uncharacterized protein n=1 Tax=Phlebiopsis gigantea (strain 11061_1 CR5-6) TaxID=745531 RepID=A0A0C3NSK0_PHLG1|nr:hypothetical protein PHLGIDRAFT_35072 [Phlebiopsis gigantea 11061_1 CR5-6]
MRLSYIAGFSVEPMSRMGFAELGQDQLLLNSIPFDEALTTQHGMDVKCLPYSSTPFSIEHATRNIPSTVRTISKGFKFEPKTVLIDIMAAYPVLIPVYLMQYEGTPLGLSGISFTSLVDAARKESLVFVENVLPELGQIATKFLGSDDLFELPDYVVAQDFLKAPWSRSTTSDFAQVKRFRGLKDEHLEELTAWIDHKVSRRGVMQHYEDIQCSLKQPVDMDHLLIRSAEEISEVHMYMHAEMKYGVSWSKCKKASSTLSEYDDELEELSKSNEKLKDVLAGGRQNIAKMNTQLEETRKCLQDMKPEWRKQWEEQQTSDYIAQVQDRFPWRAPQTDDCGL